MADWTKAANDQRWSIRRSDIKNNYFDLIARRKPYTGEIDIGGE